MRVAAMPDRMTRDSDTDVVHAKRAQRGAQRLNRYPGVDEGAEQHVAGRARETLDVHHPRHGPSLDSLMERSSTSARTR